VNRNISHKRRSKLKLKLKKEIYKKFMAYSRAKTTTNAGEDAVKQRPIYIVSGNAN
jgi:hypothetical protein